MQNSIDEKHISFLLNDFSICQVFFGHPVLQDFRLEIIGTKVDDYEDDTRMDFLKTYSVED